MFIDKKGYYGVNCYCKQRKGNYKKIRIRPHKAVAEAFIPNPCNYKVVNHLDANKLHNHYTNLEWTTYKGNSQHASKLGLLPSQKGCNNGYSKLTELDIHYIRANYYYNPGKGSNAKQLAKKFNVHPATITNVISGKCYKEII